MPSSAYTPYAFTLEVTSKATWGIMLALCKVTWHATPNSIELLHHGQYPEAPSGATELLNFARHKIPIIYNPNTIPTPDFKMTPVLSWLATHSMGPDLVSPASLTFKCNLPLAHHNSNEHLSNPPLTMRFSLSSREGMTLKVPSGMNELTLLVCQQSWMTTKAVNKSESSRVICENHSCKSSPSLIFLFSHSSESKSILICEDFQKFQKSKWGLIWRF